MIIVVITIFINFFFTYFFQYKRGIKAFKHTHREVFLLPLNFYKRFKRKTN